MVLKLPRLRRGVPMVTPAGTPTEGYAIADDARLSQLETVVNAQGDLIAQILAAQAAADAADAKAETAIADAAAAQAAADAAAAAAAENKNPLSLVAFPYFLTGTRVGSGDVTTDSTTVKPLDGTLPYTYAWTKVSGSSLNITIDSPTSETTSITATHNSAPQTRAGLIVCTVTDSSTPPRSGVVSVEYETTST
jgi:hypothetical protein